MLDLYSQCVKKILDSIRPNTVRLSGALLKNSDSKNYRTLQTGVAQKVTPSINTIPAHKEYRFRKGASYPEAQLVEEHIREAPSGQ